MAENTTLARFAPGDNISRAFPNLWQWSRGQVLQIEGLTLPASYTVHFSNSPFGYDPDTEGQIGDAEGVDVPDSMLQSGQPVYAWIWLSETTSAETAAQVIIEVNRRAQPPNYEPPTPQEEAIIDQAIAALNEGVEDAEAAATDAWNAVEHYPKIENDMWYVWDPLTQSWVNTGVSARGEGKGIETTVLNPDYTLTITYTDGTSYTTPSIRGAQGETGPTPDFSIGIVTTLDAGSDATASITGTAEEPQLNLGIPKGPKGDTGPQGPKGPQGDPADTEIVAPIVTEWLEENITQPTTPVVDKSLTVEGAAADAKATGIAVKSLAIIEEAIPGTIVSITDGGDSRPIKTLTAKIDLVQDLHGYDNPWPAGGGANILPDVSNTASRNNCDLTFANNTATLTGLANSSGGRTILRSGYFTLSAGTYYIKVFNETGSNVPSYLIQNGSDTISTTLDGQFTLSADSSMMNIGFNVTSGVNYNYKATFAVSKENISSYSPYSNICPITGWTGANVTRTGANLFSKSTSYISIAQDNNNKIGSFANVVAGLAEGQMAFYGLYVGNGSVSYTSGNIVSVAIRVKPGQTYSTTGFTKGKVYFLDKLGAITGESVTAQANYKVTFTAPSNAAYAIIYVHNYAQASTSNPWTAQEMLDGFMLTLGSDQAPEYAAYSGATIPISWQSTAGTVYGGSITLNEDGSADLVVDYVSENITGDCINSSWTNVDADRTSIGFYMSASNWLSAGYPTPVAGGGIFDYCKTGGVYNNDNWWNSQFLFTSGSFSRFEIRIPKSVLADYSTSQMAVSSAKAYLNANPLQAVYKVAPTTYHLTGIDQLSTLLGTNNIWADCGDITDLEYVADTKMYIQRLTQPTEDDMVANNDIASGKYFMVGNNLYLSTSAIAQGEAIVPGSGGNCTPKTLAEALNTINS